MQSARGLKRRFPQQTATSHLILLKKAGQLHLTISNYILNPKRKERIMSKKKGKKGKKGGKY